MLVEILTANEVENSRIDLLRGRVERRTVRFLQFGKPRRRMAGDTHIFQVIRIDQPGYENPDEDTVRR